MGIAFDQAGLGVDHERFAPHEANRPEAAKHLNYELFVFFTEPSRPLGAPPIDEVIASVLDSRPVEAMANGRHIVPKG